MRLTDPVLIRGATDMQRTPTVVSSIAKGLCVRELVRDVTTGRAKQLEELGAELAVGSFEDEALLDRAMKGVRSVFSLQVADPDRSAIQQNALIASARRNGVAQFVQSTVSGNGRQKTFPGWGTGRWLE